MRKLAPLLVVAALASAACGAARTAGVPVPRPFPGAPLPPTAAVSPKEVPPKDAAPLLSTALSFQGTPYRNGGSDPSGFDCSGFVQWVFSRHGMPLPREVKEQWRVGDTVDRDEVQPGDLVFFETVSRGASHVGIALGGDQFVHAPSSTGVVRIERYSSSYWSSRWVGARRVL